MLTTLNDSKYSATPTIDKNVKIFRCRKSLKNIVNNNELNAGTLVSIVGHIIKNVKCEYIITYITAPFDKNVMANHNALSLL